MEISKEELDRLIKAADDADDGADLKSSEAALRKLFQQAYGLGVEASYAKSETKEPDRTPKQQLRHLWLQVHERANRWRAEICGYDHEAAAELDAVIDEMEKMWPELKPPPPGEQGVIPPRTLGEKYVWLKGWTGETMSDHEARLQALEKAAGIVR